MVEQAIQRVGPFKKNLRTHHRGTKDRGGRRSLHGRKKRTTTVGIQKWNPGERLLLGNEGTLRKILHEIYGPKTRNECPRFPAGRGESQIGPCGGDDPLQNGYRNCKQRRNR
jgi:hypothetical protein